MSEIIFIYNSGAGLFSRAGDFAHKIFSPSTYPCSLCKLTYGSFGAKAEWKSFIELLPFKKSFLHADEVKRLKLATPDLLPVILWRNERGKLQELVTASELNTTSSLKELISTIEEKLDLMSET